MKLWIHQNVRSAVWKRKGTSVTCAGQSPCTMTTIMAVVPNTAWPSARVAARQEQPRSVPASFAKRFCCANIEAMKQTLVIIALVAFLAMGMAGFAVYIHHGDAD